MSGWCGRYTQGVDGWLEAFDEAVAAADPHRTPARLAELVLRFDSTVFIGESTPPAPDLPQGRPGRVVRRRFAAQLLQGRAAAAAHPDAAVWRVLGRLHRTANPRPDPGAAPGRDHEAMQRLQDARSAAEEAASVGDPLLQAIALLHRSSAERDTFDLEAALASSDAAIRLLARTPDHDQGAGLLLGALGAPSWLDPSALVRQVRCVAHVRASIASFMLRDYQRTALERQLAADEARGLVGSSPTLYAGCLWRQFTVARHVGDTRAMRGHLTDMEVFAKQFPGDERIQRELLRVTYYSSTAVGDWDAAIAARVGRAASWMRSFAGRADHPTPATAIAAVEEFHRRTQTVALTGIGNDAYEIAKCLIESGRAEADPQTAAEARGWLDAAAAAWEGTGLNGLHAVAFRRLQLDAEAFRRSRTDVGRAMVEASRGWRRVEGQRNAALAAVEHGAAGDPVVRDRLRELRDAAPTVDAAFLDLGIARWHLARGDALQDSDPQEAALAWEDALAASRAAEHGLVSLQPSGRELLLHPERHLDALRVQARALQRLRTTGRAGRDDPGEELSARARSLPSVAQRMVCAVTPQQRAAVGRATGAWLAETVELAAKAGDAATADAAMEVVRRDRVGAILGAMVADPAVPQQISDLARVLADALAISIGDTPDSGGEPAEQEPEESATRAATLSREIDTALDLTETLIGPMARDLFDPESVQRQHTGVLQSLHREGSAAVLSLWLANGPHGPRLVRRLMHRRSSGPDVEQHLDVIDAPRWLPELSIEDGTDLFFARLHQVAGVLLPPPLLEMLAAADPEHPIDLTVVPTGLLGVPFAALPVGDRHVLLDLAVITTVQSLRTALALAAATYRRHPGEGAIGIYDLDGLKYAETEWGDLARHYPPGRRLQTLHQMESAFSGGDPLAASVLALALHGLPGSDGWAQAKRLPDGQALTPGHVLRWNVPPLVVGASCFTDIRASADGELAGFPVAFQLRGASTVIGTLHEVHDRTTAEIMGLFYAGAAVGLPPAAALRAAQRTWIAKDRAARLPAAERWALFIAYGIR